MTETIPFDAIIFRAIDTLRRQMLDTGSIGQYLLALLLVKRSSDSALFDHLLQKADETGNAGRIEDALSQVEKTNTALLSEDLLGPLFSHRDRDSPREVNRALGDVIKLFSREESLARAGMADLIEPVMELLASSSHGHGGQFHTPRAVTSLIVDLLNPKSGERVYDPVCGSAGFLASALNHVRKKDASGTLQLFGQEQNVVAARVAALNLRLHDIDKRSVYIGDALLAPVATGFDIAISNPPFSQRRENLSDMLRDVFERLAPGAPPPGRADYGYVLRMLASLKRGTGRMAVIMPTGALFRGGSEKEIRRSLIERNLLDTVIALPPKMFYGTAISAVVMIFRHGRKDDSVLFIDASGDFEPGRKRNVLRDEHIKRVVETCRERSETPHYSRLVSRKELETNEFNLSLSRYIDRGRSFETADPEELSAREGMIRAELADIQRQIESCLNELQLSKD